MNLDDVLTDAMVEAGLEGYYGVPDSAAFRIRRQMQNALKTALAHPDATRLIPYLEEREKAAHRKATESKVQRGELEVGRGNGGK